MQKRGTSGEHTAAVDDVYDISNAARLKKSEVLVSLDFYITCYHCFHGPNSVCVRARARECVRARARARVYVCLHVWLIVKQEPIK